MSQAPFRLSIRTRILSAFLGVFVLFLGVTAFELSVMTETTRELRVLQDRYVQLTKVVSRLEIQQGWLDRYDLERVLKDREKVPSLYNSLVANHSRAMRDSLEDCAALLNPALLPEGYEDREGALARLDQSFGRLEAEWHDYEVASDLLLSALTEGQLDVARAQAPTLRTQLAEVGVAAQELSNVLDENTASAVNAVRGNLERAQLAGAGLSLAAAVAAVLMMLLSSRILEPISRLTEGVKQVSRGEYGGRVDVASDDEFGLLAREFNSMALSLAEREERLSRQRGELEEAYARLQATNAELKALSLYNANILNSISVGLLACDRDGRLMTANPRARALLELGDDDLGRRTLDEVPGLQLGGLGERVLLTGTTVRRDGVTFRPPQRAEEAGLLLDCTLVPLLGEDGVQGVILLIEDVTERTAIRQRLVLSERLALIGKMSAQVTHEIRNPLNALGLNAELLQEELEGLGPDRTEEARSLLGSISGEIDRLTEITEQYLSLARLPRPRLAREDLGALVRSVARFVAEDISRHAIHLDVDVEEGAPAVLLDESQIRQALLNILRNSVEASAAGGTIEVRVARRAGGVEVAVTDRGVGMDERQLSRIFDPFYSTKQRGTGLGLPVTQQIIEEHRGRITCESRPGEGTTFRMWLPPAEASWAAEGGGPNQGV